jgi:hypothetical protein
MRPRRTTTQRGLGYPHQREGKRLRAGLRDGTPCPYCGRGMYRWQELDVDDWPGRMFGGPQIKRLAHRYCNRSAGARMGNRLRGQQRRWAGPSRWW